MGASELICFVFATSSDLLETGSGPFVDHLWHLFQPVLIRFELKGCGVECSDLSCVFLNCSISSVKSIFYASDSGR